MLKKLFCSRGIHKFTRDKMRFNCQWCLTSLDVKSLVTTKDVSGPWKLEIV